MAGIERALGSLATGGMAVPVSLMEQFGTLKIQEGDTNLIKLRKIATMRQNVENALDVLAANPALGSDQKKQVQELLADIAKAVPWTVHDVQQVEFGRTPNATVREFARQSGVSSGQAAPSGTITQREIDTAPRITNDADGKAAFRALPPGAVFIAPDGKPHRKTAKDQPDGG
jgi:hypothetical protein